MLSCNEYQIFSWLAPSVVSHLNALHTARASPMAIGSENFQRPCMTTFHLSSQNNASGKTVNGMVGTMTLSGLERPPSLRLRAKPICSALTLKQSNSWEDIGVMHTPNPPWSKSFPPIASVANNLSLNGRSTFNSMKRTAQAIWINSHLTDGQRRTTCPWKRSMKL